MYYLLERIDKICIFNSSVSVFPGSHNLKKSFPNIIN